MKTREETYEAYVAKPAKLKRPLSSSNPGGQKMDEAQKKINEMMGIDNETFQKYSCKRSARKASNPVELQAVINKMMGIDSETFNKYSNKKQNQ